MSRWKIIITAVLVVLVGGLGFFAYAVYRYAFVTVPNAYAVWNTASLVNDYMDAHDGAWPGGWDDLRKTYETTSQPNPEHIADLMKRVEVDWKADPRVLAETPEPTDDKPPFRVIWLRNGSRVHWSGAGPNWLVWYHLRERRAKQAQTQPATSPTSDDGIR